MPAALSLAIFVWLLSLHPTAAGRVYAAYGGVYVTVAIAWLWAVKRGSAHVMGCHRLPSNPDGHVYYCFRRADFVDA